MKKFLFILLIFIPNLCAVSDYTVLGLGAEIIGFQPEDILGEITINANNINYNSQVILTNADNIVYNSQTILTNRDNIGYNSQAILSLSDSIYIEYLDRVFGSFGGNIVLDHSLDKRASISNVVAETLHLTMTNEAKVRFDSGSTSLKVTDTIRVFGINNSILVSDTLTIDGNLILQPFSELIFEFDDFGEDPTIIFNTDFNLTLSPNTRLVFSGNGTVVFRDNFSLSLEGPSDNQKPKLVFTNSAFLTIAAPESGVVSSKMNITGQGIIIIDDGAEIRIDSARQLIIGGRGITGVPLDIDDIDIVIDRYGIIKAAEANAKITIHNMLGTLSFEQGAGLAIADGATIEINSLNGVSSPGVISDILFINDGHLNIDGTFILGENANDNTINWDSRRSFIEGTGLVQFANQTAFAGQPIGNNRNFARDTYAEVIVRELTNTVNGLLYSTVFWDRADKQYLRVKSSQFLDVLSSAVKIVELRGANSFTGQDIVVGEDATGIDGYTGTRRRFRIISPSGLRT